LPIAFRPDGNPLEYTVFVKGRSFTVTQPDDLSFLAYFYRLCDPTPEKKRCSAFRGARLASEREKTRSANWPAGTLAR
jgi:hypothetical protein